MKGSLKKTVYGALLCSLLLPVQSWGHHGGITLTLGPGSPIETNSPLTLPEGGFVVSGRVEHVDWKKRHFAEPENKDTFTFYNLGLSYGITPYLSGSLFVPYNLKRQDRLGENEGIGDLKFLFNLGLNHTPGKGMALNADEDTAVTFEETRKTYLGLYGGFTAPTGKSREKLGGEVDRGMQPGFRSPTFTLGASAARQIADPLTLVADVSYEIFTEKDDFKFGNEARANLAGVYEIYGNTDTALSKLDGILELNLLNIARDEEDGHGQDGTGGTILYLSPGVRFTFGDFHNASLGLMVKFPIAKDLNEKSEQQGAEGLENYRAIGTLSFFF